MNTAYTAALAEQSGIGDCLELRDFSGILDENAYSEESRPDRWQLLPYRLLDGTTGKMLFVSARTKEPPVFNGTGLPPEVLVPLPGKGRFSISFGIPLLPIGPVLAGPAAAYGMDAALGDSPFTGVFLEYGLRYGRILEESGREIFCRYGEVECNGGFLRLRVPFGAFRALPLGYVRGVLSSIRFVRLPDASEKAKKRAEEEGRKPLIVVTDGFSHYFEFANQGENLDKRLPEVCKNSDVRVLMMQTHGPTLWKSKITSYFGEGVTEEGYAGKRAGDRRIGEYVSWAVEEGESPLKTQAERCRANGLEFHYSLRANLFFPAGGKHAGGPLGAASELFLNGRWWVENPDARLPGSHKLDFANPKAQDYLLALFSEALEEADPDGLNLDLTRWPPVFDPKRHDGELLLTIVMKLRELADRHGEKMGRPVRLSLTMADGYHAGTTLENQKIDFERLMKEKLLDFVCVQAYDIKPFCEIARRYQIPCYGVLDGESPYWPGGWREDPLWKLPDGGVQDDPTAGEEFKDQPNLRCCLTPREIDFSLDRMYEQGADGIFCVNHFYGDRNLLDAGSRELVKRRAAGEEWGQVKGQPLFLVSGKYTTINL